MINKECLTTEWIAQKSTELQYNDKNLIEKVIRAMFADLINTGIITLFLNLL